MRGHMLGDLLGSAPGRLKEMVNQSSETCIFGGSAP